MLSTFVMVLLSHSQAYGDKGKREIASEKHQSQRSPRSGMRGVFFGSQGSTLAELQGGRGTKGGCTPSKALPPGPVSGLRWST